EPGAVLWRLRNPQLIQHDSRSAHNGSMSRESIASKIQSEIASWPGVTVAAHVGGLVFFHVGHGDRFADLPFLSGLVKNWSPQAEQTCITTIPSPGGSPTTFAGRGISNP